MDCENCGHPLNLHDPCSAKGCDCRAYEPHDRKERAAMLTDISDSRPKPPTIREARERELRKLGGRLQ